ncbi:MAG: MarR family transcriptional regulator [Oscillospiraceae bacterium]|nr:MarR family transcriptional regulator [Oscillospiraceae bacterium]
MKKMPIQDYNYFDTMAKAQKGYARLMDPICRKWNLTRNELDVMLFLANNPEYDRAVDIVQNRGLSKSHVSLSITNLESRGMLTRTEDTADRRTVHLKLTAKANEAVRQGQLAQKRFFTYLHQGVTQEQIDLMMDFARKVGENIKNIEEVIE